MHNKQKLEMGYEKTVDIYNSTQAKRGVGFDSSFLCVLIEKFKRMSLVAAHL